jgi:hypothetical protein
MEYLLEVQWIDPTACSVARILSALPDGVEQATADLPTGTSKAFCVLRAEDPQALAGIVHDIAEVGVATRLLARAGR